MKTHRLLAGLTRAFLLIAVFAGLPALQADQTITGNLNVTGLIDADGNNLTFGTQGASFGGALLYQDNAADTFTFSTNRNPASWLWLHSAAVAAMRLDSNHQLILYQSNGTTAGITLTPASNALSLGSATLTASGTTLSTNGGFTVAGNFTNSNTSAITSFMGNVGIGTASINNPAGFTRMLQVSAAGSAVFSARDTAHSQQYDFGVMDPAGTGSYDFTIYDATAGLHRLVVKQSGNVGIGTTTPAGKLHLYSGASGQSTPNDQTQLVLEDDTHLALSFLTPNTQTQSIYFGDPQDARVGQIRYDHATDDMWFTTADGQVMTLYNGNVGIGTTSPSTRLEVAGPDVVWPLWQSEAVRVAVSVHRAGVGVGAAGANWGTSLFQDGTKRFTIESNGGALIGTNFVNANAPVNGLAVEGNVGIGTASPQTKLVVSNSGTMGLEISPTSISDSVLIQSYDRNASTYKGIRFDASKLSFLTNGGSTAFAIDPAGNVGIGTANPGQLLHVNGGNATILVTDSNSGGGNFRLGAADGSKGQWVFDGSANTYFDFAQNLRLRSLTGGTIDRLTILSNGNVGIGTVSPGIRLTVAGGGGYTGVQIGSESGGSYLRWSREGRTGDANKLNIYDQDAGATIATFQSGGNVGIGTTSPGRLLELKASEPYLRFNPTAVAGAYVFGAGDGKFYFTPESTYVATMTFANGNVGIGTTTPQAKLDVNGDLYVGYNTATTSSVLKAFATAHAPGNVPSAFATGLSDGGGVVGMTVNNVRDGSFNSQSIAFTTHHGGVSVGTRMTIDKDGNVGIGTVSPSAKLAVKGTIRANEVIVDTGWADYVFEEGYKLAPLSEVETHIHSHGHLPGIPSAAEVAEKGVSMGDMQSRLLSKIEEITLHQIAQEKEILALKAQNASLQQQVTALKAVSANP